MDPFDDFEMKPITTGLGFHKRKTTDDEIAAEVKREIPKFSQNQNFGEEQELNELMSALDRVSNNLAGSMADVQSKEKSRKTNLDKDIEIIEALPRKAMQIDTPTIGRNMPPIIEDLPKTRKSPEKIPNVVRKEVRSTPAKTSIGTRRGAADSPVNTLKPAVFSISSAVLDMLVVLAMALLFLISLLLVTGVQLTMVFKGLQSDVMTQASMAMLYVAVLQLYVIVSRSFFGKTLGEWTFDFQMGDSEQIKSPIYPILVLWRSIIIMVTGVITLPLLSTIFRIDFASYLTGLQFYKKS